MKDKKIQTDKKTLINKMTEKINNTADKTKLISDRSQWVLRKKEKAN